MEEGILKHEEKAVFSLRSLYRRYGYTPYRMSKFEEYEYYIRNKDFLLSDRIITFNDTNGKLLALKPDVTLSIIRNGEDRPGYKQKVCYNENIYRVSESTRHYKEIMHAGLECIGDIDLYDIYEAVSLAAQSLALISPDFVLQISHMGMLTSVLDSISMDTEFRQQAISFIGRKDTHDLIRLCRGYGIGDEQVQLLTLLVTVYGNREEVLERLIESCSACAPQAMAELKALSALLDRIPQSDRIVFDFSVVNNMNYYNGIVFAGFVSGISDSILAGGQYDNLMRKLGRTSGAIGFALYLDLLEQLPAKRQAYDVDVLLVYDRDTPMDCVTERVEQLITEGKTVSVQRTVPQKLRYREIIRM
jgi:ATP phosphoribosyltransferase regulatory subunit